MGIPDGEVASTKQKSSGDGGSSGYGLWMRLLQPLAFLICPIEYFNAINIIILTLNGNI